jgi:hypothetical protein
MQIAGTVVEATISGEFQQIKVEFSGGGTTTFKIAANITDGHEIKKGDTVDVYIHDGRNSGVSRHPRKT